jgi:hypothetical protein
MVRLTDWRGSPYRIKRKAATSSKVAKKWRLFVGKNRISRGAGYSAAADLDVTIVSTA